MKDDFKDPRSDEEICAQRETLQIRYKRILHYIEVFLDGDLAMMGELFLAILMYGKGEEPTFSDNSPVRWAFESIRPDLDSDTRKYIETARKRYASSKKRWADEKKASKASK